MRRGANIKPAAFYLVASAIFFAAAIGFTYPLICNCHTDVLGYIGFENTAQTLWIYNAWYQYQTDLFENFFGKYGWSSILHADEFYRQIMAFPERNSVSNGLDFFWTVPLAKIFGFPLYYNVKCWLVLAINALCAMMIARHLKASWLAAFTAGAAFAFNPYHFYLLSTGRMIETQTFMPALYILSLLYTWKKESPLTWAMAGAMLGLVTDNYWFYGHFTIIFTVVFLIYNLIVKNPPRLGTLGRNLFFYLTAFLVTVLPFAHPYLVRWAIGDRIPGMIRPDPGSYPSMIRLTRQMIAFSAEADYPIRQQSKNINSPTSSPWWLPLQCTFSANITLLAILPSIIRRKGGFWLCGALVFYLLPLGPFLKYGGGLVEIGGNNIPLPYLYLIQYFPLLTKLFWPNQSMFLFALCLSMLMAIHLDWLFKKPGLGKMWPAIIACSIIAAMTIEMKGRNQLPIPQTQLNIPPVYVKEGFRKGYIFLPIGRRYWEVPRDFNRDYYHGADLTIVDLHLAMSEGKGLFGRPHYMAGKDYWLFEIANLSSHPYLRWLVSLGTNRKRPEFTDAQERQVIDEGYDYIVVHERICAHIQDKGSYKVNFEEGRSIFDKICQELKARYGPAVYHGTETSWDQGIVQGTVTAYPYRVTIFKISK